ncbi:hypothetical protein CEP51_016531 [Fusarium floridanum]|uniref:C2H2-type domain-containing protein n=1 Tax=Fusarium floridanum TaxID=1325733 RepID=A0A428NMD9_9HYPO|nr:hypothetical protein CEP51_016531 [Fusarium floridanum]
MSSSSPVQDFRSCSDVTAASIPGWYATYFLWVTTACSDSLSDSLSGKIRSSSQTPFHRAPGNPTGRSRSSGPPHLLRHVGFGLQHENFKFQSSAPIYGEALKRKLDVAALSNRSGLGLRVSVLEDQQATRSLAGDGLFQTPRSSQCPIQAGIRESSTRTVMLPRHSFRCQHTCPSYQDPVIDGSFRLDPSARIHWGNKQDHATAPVSSRRNPCNARRRQMRQMRSFTSLPFSDAKAAGGQPSWQASPLLDRARHDDILPITPAPLPARIGPLPSQSMPRAATGMIKWRLNQLQRTTAPVLFSCQCCTKRPQIFRTAQELAAHETKKRYKCPFCTSRFKNKNESLRHQNSIHTRSQSWSCAALLEYNQLFYTPWDRPGEADVCTYCGAEFSRSGGGGAGPGAHTERYATNEDWVERIKHAHEAHNFQGCDLSKRFYRADHHKQHLRYSHLCKDGRWLDSLVRMCMTSEDVMPKS